LLQILQAKIQRLEHLLHLKDIRIEDLSSRAEELEKQFANNSLGPGRGRGRGRSPQRPSMNQGYQRWSHKDSRYSLQGLYATARTESLDTSWSVWGCHVFLIYFIGPQWPSITFNCLVAKQESSTPESRGSVLAVTINQFYYKLSTKKLQTAQISCGCQFRYTLLLGLPHEIKLNALIYKVYVNILNFLHVLKQKSCMNMCIDFRCYRYLYNTLNPGLL
jgi:hypothetical protein